MTARQFIVLGILLMTQSALAITDGTYIAEQANLVLEADVWTKGNEADSMQFIRVRQVAPIVKEVPPIYILVQKGVDMNRFEFGDLVLRTSENRFVHLTNGFVAYREPLSMKQLLVLAKANGEETAFQFVTSASRF